MSSHHLDRTEKYLLALWFLVNLCIGLWIVRDFGMSYDEPNYYLYAQSTVDAYKSIFGLASIPDFGLYPNYGPAFIIFPELAIRILKLILPNISTVDVWHFSYFLIFQIGGLCLYSLARRWFSIWSAWSILLLYTFQPILWGHAFINPKDIPFMAFCLLTIWSGFRLTDSLGAQNTFISLQPVLKKIWSSIEESKRQRFIKLLKFEAYAFLFIAILTLPLNSLIKVFIAILYSSDPASFLSKWFHAIAANGTGIPLENYIHKAQNLFFRIEKALLLTGAFILLFYFIWLFINGLNNARQKTVGTNQTNQAYQFTWKEFLFFFRLPKLIFAGILLGLTISIRVLGPLPGIIIILYLIFTFRQKSLPVILAYLTYAALATFLTWPYLWTAPITHFTESIVLMSNFPWSGHMLFNGHYYTAGNLPISYLPILMNIQLTETLLFLIYFGCIVLIWSILYKRVRLDLILVVIVGALLPLAGLIISRASMYDNFRQLLFMIPPLILLAGIALDTFFTALKPPVIRIFLLLALTLPGMSAITRLHPYEYIYYNTFIGGIRGADGNFELDYWRTSLPKITLELNRIAIPNAQVLVTGFIGNIMPYVRADLIIEKLGDDPKTMEDGYDYAIFADHSTADRLYPTGKILVSVKCDEVVLSVVKAVKGVASK